ncbi:MAG TPA: OmpH family outer membrane protein [Rhizomicrobium sp.]|jgi:Skp family chaperone for outer membrane proteins
MKRIVLAALIGAGWISTAWAEEATPVIQPLGGPVIAGVCLLSQEAVVANAKVGKAATARLKQISDLAQSEIGADRSQFDFDVKAVQSQQAALKPEEFQQKQLALQARLQALEQKAALRNREIEVTRQKALGRIATAAQPVIAEVYKSKNCGLLFNRNTALGGNFANDLTASVVAGLDAKITTITFDKEDLSAIQNTAAVQK